METLLFIFNPATGGGKIKSNLMEILCRFSSAGYELLVWPTHGVGDARRVAQQEGAKADLVVCCGGDGTLSEVVDGLMKLDKMPQLGYIPGGTACDFASSLLLPKNDMLAATERILQPKKVYHCDVGLLDDRAFTYVAAFGAFTDVSYKTPQKYKNALGYFAYILEGMQQLPNLQPHRVRIACENDVYEDDYLLGMIANSTSVAGFSFPDKKKVRLDDGVFELLLVKQPASLGELGELSSALLRGNASSPLLTMLRVSEAHFSCEEALPFTLDGEYGGRHKETVFRVAHKALPVRI